MAERYKFPFGNTVGVQENLISINEEAIKGLRQRIDRFKFLVREQGLSPNDAKKIVIEEFQLNRNPKAGTPKWMSKGKTELIAEGFDYQASARGPKNVGGVEKYLQKRKNVIGEGGKFEERIKRTKQKTGLGKAYEMAHTANIFQAKKLGIDYPINALAIQTQNVNNKVAEVLNDELKPLYRKQLKLFNKMKRKNTPALAKQMDKINFQIGELVATGGSQGNVAANVLKPIIVDPDTVKGKILDLGFDTSTEVMASPGATTKATAAGSIDDVMARANVESFLSSVRTDAANNGQICSLVRTKKANGGTISCVDAVEEAIQENPKKLAQDASKIDKFKNSAQSFLKSPLLRGAGKFGALAAVGAATAGAVKKFMNDDPTTYLSNEEQQKNMLIDMVTGSLDDTPQERPEILDYQLPALGGAAVAGTAAVAPSTIKAARSGALGAKTSGITKTALKTLGRGLAAVGTPAGLLATEPLFIAGQVQQGDSLTDIATNPMNYLGAAFMGPATEFATKGLSPTIAKTMRLGISPSVLKTVSRRFGLPGLALSAGISGYETV
jgi:hypothetical protein